MSSYLSYCTLKINLCIHILNVTVADKRLELQYKMAAGHRSICRIPSARWTRAVALAQIQRTGACCRCDVVHTSYKRFFVFSSIRNKDVAGIGLY